MASRDDPAAKAELSVGPSTVELGSEICVAWKLADSPALGDWIGLFLAGEDDPFQYLEYRSLSIDEQVVSRIMWLIDDPKHFHKDVTEVCFKYFHGEDGIVTATSPIVKVRNPFASIPPVSPKAAEPAPPVTTSVESSSDVGAVDSIAQQNSSTAGRVPSENGIDHPGDSDDVAVLSSTSVKPPSGQRDEDGEAFLRITLRDIHATGLRKGVLFNPYPYVKFCVKSKPEEGSSATHFCQEKRSSVANNTTNPDWSGQEFSFLVSPSDVIEVEVKDKTTKPKSLLNRHLGKTAVPVTVIQEKASKSPVGLEFPLSSGSSGDALAAKLSFTAHVLKTSTNWAVAALSPSETSNPKFSSASSESSSACGSNPTSPGALLASSANCLSAALTENHVDLKSSVAAFNPRDSPDSGRASSLLDRVPGSLDSRIASPEPSSTIGKLPPALANLVTSTNSSSGFLGSPMLFRRQASLREKSCSTLMRNHDGPLLRNTDDMSMLKLSKSPGVVCNFIRPHFSPPLRSSAKPTTETRTPPSSAADCDKNSSSSSPVPSLKTPSKETDVKSSVTPRQKPAKHRPESDYMPLWENSSGQACLVPSKVDPVPSKMEVKSSSVPVSLSLSTSHAEDSSGGEDDPPPLPPRAAKPAPTRHSRSVHKPLERSMAVSVSSSGSSASAGAAGSTPPALPKKAGRLPPPIPTTSQKKVGLKPKLPTPTSTEPPDAFPEPASAAPPLPKKSAQLQKPVPPPPQPPPSSSLSSSSSANQSSLEPEDLFTFKIVDADEAACISCSAPPPYENQDPNQRRQLPSQPDTLAPAPITAPLASPESDSSGTVESMLKDFETYLSTNDPNVSHDSTDEALAALSGDMLHPPHLVPKPQLPKSAASLAMLSPQNSRTPSPHSERNLHPASSVNGHSLAMPLRNTNPLTPSPTSESGHSDSQESGVSGCRSGADFSSSATSESSGEEIFPKAPAPPPPGQSASSAPVCPPTPTHRPKMSHAKAARNVHIFVDDDEDLTPPPRPVQQHPALPPPPSFSAPSSSTGASVSGRLPLRAPPRLPSTDFNGDPLPEHFECRIDSHGRVYYIDHVNRTTTWVRPTLNNSVQLRLRVDDAERRQLDRRYQSIRRTITSRMDDDVDSSSGSSGGGSTVTAVSTSSSSSSSFSPQLVIASSSSDGGVIAGGSSGQRRTEVPTSALLTSPGLRFLTRSDFASVLSLNPAAREVFQRSPTMKHMIARVRQDSSLFQRYQNTREMVGFLNMFAETSKPLPVGWQEKMDESHKRFFVDHTNKTTTFIDPRLPLEGADHRPLMRRRSRSSGDEERNPPVPPPRPPVPNPGVLLSSAAAATSTSSSSGSAGTLPSSSYTDQVVAFLRQPNVMEVLAARYAPLAASSPNPLREEILEIRSKGAAGLEKYQNDVDLTIMLSLFEEEIMSFVPSPIGANPTLTVARAGSSNESPGMNRATGGGNARNPSAPYKRDFEAKLRGFYRKLESKGYGQGPGKLKLNIRRDRLLEDAYSKIMTTAKRDLQKHRLCVTFQGEEGLDYGGPSREFFFLLSRELFNPYYGLFEYSANDTYTVQISPLSAFIEGHRAWFRFCGRVLGLALVHQYLLDVFFTRPFYKSLLRLNMNLSDLESLDSEFHSSLLWLTENEVTEDMDLTFCVNEEVYPGKVVEKELKSGGKKIPVTAKNKQEYIERLVRWRIERGTVEQTKCLVEGFYDVIDPRLVSCFDAQELELVIAGTLEIDVQDWRRNAEYRSGYHESHQVIKWFWSLVESWDNERRLRLLQFVTGTSSVPYEGFSALRGSTGPRRFCIEKWGKPTSLPRAHTCFNRLDLPPYPSFEMLREKLLLAIEETNTLSIE